MDYVFSNKRATIKGLENFSLAQCLDSGQTFRWRPFKNGFFGVALGCAVYAEQNGGTLTIDGVDERKAREFIRYFDLERDYSALQQHYSFDPFIKDGISYASGLRVLAQPYFETLITFIISANNNIARIKRIVEALCAKFGPNLGKAVYGFPTAAALSKATLEELFECGTGYRARYIKATAKMITEGFELDKIAKLPYEAARKALTVLPGVGLKVADCVALFGFSFLQAFPFDVWMKRVLSSIYGYGGTTDAHLRKFVDEKFGAYAGIAQQYLFHYARNHKNMLCNP